MNRPSFSLKHYQIAIATMLLASYGLPSLAQELGIASNTVTVSNAGGGLAATPLAISTDGTGTVADISGIPTSGTLDVPTFTFTLEEDAVADDVKEFVAGIIIDEDASDRRLEIMIPTIEMDFTGAGLVGSVAAQTVTVRGRNADSSIALEGTSGSGVASFSGSSLTFNADNQIALIIGEGGILANIVDDLDNTGLSYTYKIVLNQTSGAAVAFGTDAGDLGFMAFPTAAAGFTIIDGTFATALDGGYVLSGTMSFGSSGSSSTPAEAANEANDEIAADTNALSNDLINNGLGTNTVADYKALVAATKAKINTIASAVATQAVPPSAMVTALNGLRSQLVLGKLIINAGGVSDVADLAAMTENARTLIDSVKGLTLTSVQRGDIKLAIEGMFADFSDLLRALFTSLGSSSSSSIQAITTSTVVADTTQLVDEVQATVADLLSVSGVELDPDLYDSVQDVSQAATELVLSRLGTQVGLTVTYTTDAAARTLLSGNAMLLDRLLDVVAINVGTGNAINDTTTTAALESAGLSSTLASDLAEELASFVLIDELSIDSGDGAATVDDTLLDALSADTVTTDAITASNTVTLGTASFSVAASSVSIAPAAFPSGTFALPNGTAVVISDGISIQLLPSSAELVQFVAAIDAVDNAAFTTSVTDSGRIVLTEVSSGITFNAAFTYGVTTGTTAGDVSFVAATGDPASSSYLIQVVYEDGSSQGVIPTVADSAFFTSVANFGFAVATNPDTGVITIDGFNFRPDYFRTQLTPADSVFLALNDDSSGVAYRTVDANGDGLADVEVLTVRGLQILYGLQ